ncbi:MAG TPA: hypothetical protein VKB41_17435 [Steroidobacteraceae bacterium]|jgi:hypothetical protein|nr:hypothetical protein [Steroidobacteraceae bacterium]
MPRAKVVEFDYYQFLNLLRRATDSGARIDKSDARWAEYVKKNSINEVAATAIALQKFEKVVPVIISEGQDTDGLYFYSKNEEGCLRLVPA